MTAKLPWRGIYSLWLEFSTGAYPCDDDFLRGKVGDIAYDKNAKLVFRGADWPLNWEIYDEQRLLGQGSHSRNLYTDRKENGVIGAGCHVYRKFAVVNAAEKTFNIAADLHITQAVIIPAKAKSFVILRLDKPASRVVQTGFSVLPTLDWMSVLFWHSYGFLWLWGTVAFVSLVVLALRSSEPDKVTNDQS